MTAHTLSRAGWTLLTALALAAPGGAREADDARLKEPIRYEAFAVDREAPGGTASGRIEIVVERWTTEAERTKLRQALEKGSDELLNALQDTPKAGYIRNSGGGLGWSVQYARRHVLPGGGSRVVIATDRPMSFYERTSHPRSADYEFLVAELRLDKDGRGEGKLIPAAQITFGKGANTIEIENYDREPVSLTRVVEDRGDEAKTKAASPQE